MGHGSKRFAQKILVKTGDYDPKAPVRKFLADGDEPFVEKLCLVYSNHTSVVADKLDYPGGIGDRRALKFLVVVRGDVFSRISRVNCGLEYLDALFCNLREPQTPDEFFGLSGEHRPANHLNPAGMATLIHEHKSLLGAPRALISAPPPKAIYFLNISLNARMTNDNRLAMSEELKILKEVAEKLNRAAIPYMVSGSVAMNFYAHPRMTRDIDIVIVLSEDNIKTFIDLFKDSFYLEEETVMNEVRRLGMFNLIHSKYIIKLDFILQKNDEFSVKEFGRRKEIDVEETKISIISPEDLILSKLNWAKDSFSEIQLRDVGNIRNMVEDLDIQYINEWVDKLGLQKIYARVP